MPATYRIQQFAELAGVTVKTLHHYDRLGLLRPLRTAAGYRVYTNRDLHRLEQIAALKVIGIPLQQVRALLEGDARPLGAVLASQKRVLQARRRVLDAAIAAIEHAQRRQAAGSDDESETLRTLIEAMEMQHNVDVLKDYFEAAAWQRWRALHDEWPGPGWRTLLRQIEAALDSDPVSDIGVAFAERWHQLMKADFGGDAGARTAFNTAWRDWVTRPQSRPPQLASFDMDRILPFMVNAIDERHERLRRASPETSAVPQRVSPSRLRLFRDAAQALSKDPGGDAARALIRRLEAVIEGETGGDQDLKAEILAAWQHRRTWPSGVLRWVASTYDMTPETWLAVADYLERARAASPR